MPRLYTIDEAAEQLRISRAQVYRLIRSTDLPSLHIGKRHFVRSQDIDSFIEGLSASGNDAADFLCDCWESCVRGVCAHVCAFIVVQSCSMRAQSR